MNTHTLYIGDALDVLRTLPDESVQTCVTSPPYYALRDYQTARWVGGDPNCNHRSPTMRAGRNENRATLAGSVATNSAQLVLAANAACGLCDAVRVDAQIGLERTPEEYVAAMVEVFREVRRVLRKDGTCWLNLGDSYARDPRRGVKFQNGSTTRLRNQQAEEGNRGVPVPKGLKEKDLVGIPWRVAFALQADGWWLRSDIIWAKPNPMPESVTDRPTRSHEYLFLLTKSERYAYDAEAIKEPCAVGDAGSYFDRGKTGHHDNQGADKRDKQRLVGKQTYAGFNDRWDASPTQTRNKRDVWTIATEPFPGAHFAVMPQALVEPCVLAGTSPQACPTCGAPWVRVTERNAGERDDAGRTHSTSEQRMGKPPPGTRMGDGYADAWVPAHLHLRGQRRIRPLHRPGPLRRRWHSDPRRQAAGPLQHLHRP